MSIIVLEKILEDTLQLIKLARKGIEYPLFQNIALAGPFTIKEWSNYLHITERTLQRYKKEQKTLEQPYAERILEIAKLQKRGKDIFGSIDVFNQWLNSNIIALGGIQPKTLLDNAFGIELLNTELTRIEHGVLA